MVELSIAPPIARSCRRPNLTMEVVHGGGMAKIMVRPGVDDADWALSLGLPLPRLGRIARAGELTCIALAPQEWLIRLDPEPALPAVLDRVRSAMPTQASLVIDVSDAVLLILLSGDDSTVALGSICPLDLSSAAFPAESAASTMLGDVTGIIIRPGIEPVFQLIVDQTVADYIWRLLAIAGGFDGEEKSG